MNYKVVPIRAELARSVRKLLISPQYKHPASVATGYGQCRQCLKKLIIGEDERILFTYNAFENLSNLPLPGPNSQRRSRLFCGANRKLIN